MPPSTTTLRLILGDQLHPLRPPDTVLVLGRQDKTALPAARRRPVA
ncbi:hypothetical protein BN2497_3747 [Janthinobacterium sp. CG23_2]|nr:hypothetical protein BN2497_3747 [Janthinobacterium sp. CG23_2]CUU28271.1 hypothetical protein BN3177_3747 [Janthinobacterium sp. CG23_2]